MESLARLKAAILLMGLSMTVYTILKIKSELAPLSLISQLLSTIATLG